MARTGTSIETESRLLVARAGRVGGDTGKGQLRDGRFLLEVMKCPKIDCGHGCTTL